MRLSELLKPLLQYEVYGDEDPVVSCIQADSRKVVPGAMFVAILGHTVDGHAFIKQAVDNGAVALLVEKRQHDVTVPQVIVSDSRRTSAMLADVLYRHPSTALSVIGVTGTNGKTTVTHMIHHILEVAQKRSGLIGTVGVVIGDRRYELANTTPEAVELHGYLLEMMAHGCSHAVMEVSSHALVERRVAGIAFHVGVFTNLSQDHLDFHGTMDAYADAKALLFARLGNTYGDTLANNAYSVVNVDDPYAARMLDATTVQSITYGLVEPADVTANDIVLSHHGVKMTVHTPKGSFPLETALIGRFNVYNILAAVATAFVEGLPLSTIAEALANYAGVPGRCERVDMGQPFGVFVDYAHTPDGLENVLSTVREFAQGRVICVVGCGGDRDKTKRPLMARIALRWSDLALFTSDNPRTEDPESILDDMEVGVRDMEVGVRQMEVGLQGAQFAPVHDSSFGQWPQTHAYVRIADRRSAIVEAVNQAQAGDVLVIAGKGHEDYQVIGRTKIHFDDREEARLALSVRLDKL